MKFIVNPEKKRDYSYCPPLGNCMSYIPCKKCPALGNGCLTKDKECGVFYVTLCADCGEDPKFCGDDVNVLE